ncbi:MAG: LysM peptidoglycan-binding domain-containing protein [Anaerolineae bacterium]|nr:LysM peptidoglycan-binding domain-containing protein [Anaerolineae bacterium]
MRDRFFMCLIVAGMLWLPASLFAQDATPIVPPGVTIHVVQRGETLSRIAQNYGITVSDLVRLNGIADPSTIYTGQRLLVPSADATPLPAPSVVHVVQPGETLDSIALLYGMSAADLMALNNMSDTSSFYVGALLDVSSPAPTAQPTDAPATTSTPIPVIVHTVVRGETMYRIASQYGVTVNAIAQANHISDPTVIYAGQQLVIPGFEAPEVAFGMPAPVESLDITPLVFIEGQIGRIQLTTASAVTMTGTFLNETLHDAAENDGMKHTLLVPIPLGTTPAVYTLSLALIDATGAQTDLPINIQVVSGNYGLQRINIASNLLDLLNPTTEAAELDKLRSITSSFTPTRYFDGPLGLPSSAPLSSRFGALRSYNGADFTRYHTGTDFTAGTGSPIIAPADGRVVFVGPLDIRGNVTIIDHGWGVFTVYCHQTEQRVNVGDFVTTGQVIGTAGSTGRVTGPHLHWELWVDGVVVNAMQWVSQSFS